MNSYTDEECSNEEETILPGQDPDDFSSPWHFSDIVLVVEGTKFHVHKSTLSIWSPVFRAMFTSQFSESTAKEIPLPGKHADEIKELLKVIYSSEAKNKVNKENYQFLIELAEEYQMDQVKQYCLNVLSSFTIDESNCLELFKVSEHFDVEEVKEECIEEAKFITAKNLEASQCYKDLKPEVKVTICMERIKELEETLKDYINESSNLVEKVFQKIFNTTLKNSNPLPELDSLDDHIFAHKLGTMKRQTELRKAALTKASLNKSRNNVLPHESTFHKFHFLCQYCIQRVQEADWEVDFNFSVLKKPLYGLYLLLQYRTTKGLKKSSAETLQSSD